MSIELEKGLVSVLSGTATCYPRIPQKPTYPLVRYQRGTTDRVNNIGGGNSGPTEATLQVDCIASTYDAAKTLADSVRGVLHGYIGTWGTLTAHFVTLQVENDFYEEDGDRVTHWVSQRYQIWTNMD